MHIIIKAMLIVAGVIHILPLPGLIGAMHLERLYGITFKEPNLLIMMRHRAILFGLLGAFMIYAAFRAELDCNRWRLDQCSSLYCAGVVGWRLQRGHLADRDCGLHCRSVFGERRRLPHPI
jgi:hypothetical protein